MEGINAFVRAAALGVPPPQAQPDDLYDIILPRQGKAVGGQATFATSGRRITLTAATSHFPGTRRPQPTPSVSTTKSSQLPALTTSLPRPFITGGNDITNPQPCPKSTQSSSTKPDTKSIGIAILAAVFFFIRKRVKGGGQPKTTTESFDFEPPARTNPNLSRAETAAMAELMRIAYRVENEGDDSRVSYYPGQPPIMEKTRPGFPGGAAGVAAGTGLTTPYDESRQADNVARMQSLGSESVAQLGLKHPVGRWVHIQRPGAAAERTSAYNVPDMPATPGLPDRYSTSNLYSGVAR
ncbi:hypothetical protein LA080_001660 [Diaporthe eres]|nr:hypothetical protein LA080_001660 [Diaporthe eres]